MFEGTTSTSELNETVLLSCRSPLLEALAAVTLLFTVGCGSSDSEGETSCGEPGQICTFMGNGNAALGKDGAAPEQVSLYLPQDLTWGPDGRPYILDWNNHRVRSVIDGKVQTVIGTGELGDAPEGLATETRLNHPTHISFSPNGDLILSAWHNSKVMRMDPDTRRLELLCGTGARSYAGESIPASDAVVDLPVATAFDGEGRMYIMDQGNQRIRMVDAEGVIRTVLGPVGEYLPHGYVEVCSDVEPEPGQARDCKFCRDGDTDFDTCQGPPARPQGFQPGSEDARQALMHQPFTQSAPPAGGMEAAPDGRVIFVDTGNHLVRSLNPDGTVSTVAGKEPEPYLPEDLPGATPKGGFEGDGGDLALDARFHNPRDVAVAPDGTIFVADTLNSCVRKITAKGGVYTIAGVCGERGFAGDGGVATEAMLDRPYGIALDHRGNLYIADTYNHRIRVVSGVAGDLEP